MSGPAAAVSSHRLVLTFALAVLATLIIRTAWVSDDAYLTFRTVDNFVHGVGLRWNAADRVQAYTDPLWMFVLSAVYFFTREIFYTSIAVSVALSLWAVWFIARRIALDEMAALVAVTI